MQELVSAVAVVGDQTIEAHGEYTEDAVIGEVVGQLVGNIRRRGHDHLDHRITVSFTRNAQTDDTQLMACPSNWERVMSVSDAEADALCEEARADTAEDALREILAIVFDDPVCSVSEIVDRVRDLKERADALALENASLKARLA